MKKKFLSVICIALVVITAAIGFSACGGKFDVNKNITVVAREDGSGTKTAFMEFMGLKGKADVSGVIVASSSTSMLVEIKNNPLAIGYESLGSVTSDVKKLTIDGVAATVDNIANGSYIYARPLSIVYKEATVASGANQAFYTFLQSATAQDVILENGYASIVSNAPIYTVVNGLSGTINISGSTSLQPLMIALAQRFEELQGGVNILVQGGGSGTGKKDAVNGVSHFGMISEDFVQAEAVGCVHYEVAKDGIAVIVNKLNTFDDISIEQLTNIYNKDAGSDAIKKWSQLL